MAGIDVVVCGSLNMDLLGRVAALPQPGETVPGLKLNRLPGGKGLNQAVAAARMGAYTAMLGACADDTDGDTLRALLVAEGIDTRFVAVRETRRWPDAHTGLAMVWVAGDGENSIVVHGGANATLTPEEVRSALYAEAAAAKVAMAQLETPLETVAAFLEVSRAQGALTLLNTAPALPGSLPLLALADIVVLNETELAHYAQAPITAEGFVADAPSIETCMRLAQQLAAGLASSRGSVPTMVVTLGALGALTLCGEEVAHYPAPRVTPLDTTGAGDCFCGVLAAALAAELPLPAAVQRANRAAALAVGRTGAAPAMPRAQELADN
ncbi:MAG: ribokinase [Sinobacteraceae bacterium]|nr:ribokinase [Nevskiaceae bacterium]